MSVRTRSAVQDLPQLLGKVYGKVAQYLGTQGVQPIGPPYVGYYNMDMQDLDLEIGFPVAQVIQGQGDVQSSEIPEGQYATCLYTGPYSDIGLAYTALTQWVDTQGSETTGVAYELYLNDPAQTAPEELQTQILFLLERI
jgi:effector-binding domain-containing protein